MATKFVRGLVFNSGSTTVRVTYMMKFMYEFWGYCIYGGASLTSPGTGAFAATTPTNFPTNFTEGTSVVASGSDGYTNATTIFRYDGYQDFFAASAPFNSNMVGKQLVIWKPNSGSSEDSIYNIIAFKSATNIVVNVNNGGTPSAPDGYKPSFTSRSSINYRVVDIATAGTSAGVADNQYIVFQLDPTGINTGQANSQLQIFVRAPGSSDRFEYKISPGGTWNGTAFTDGTAQTVPNSGNNSVFFFNVTSGTGISSINLIGDKDFLIGNQRDSGNNHIDGFTFHWEIPERLYSSAQDTNPVVVNIGGYNTGPFHSTSTTYGYGGGFNMRCSDGLVRQYRTAVRGLMGDGTASFLSNFSTTPQPPGNLLTDFRAGANSFTGNLLNSQGVLCLPAVNGQYSLARVRLRRVRFANTFMARFTRFSSNGDFILITQGVAVPWDKTVIPYNLFPFGTS